MTVTTAAHAQSCTHADFAAAVDKSGAQLRDFSIEAGPALQEKMRRYAAAAKVAEDQAEDSAFEAIQDAKLQSLDEQSAGLLLKIDSLGRIGENAPLDCAKLDEINTASAVLLAVMRQKSEYMLNRLDQRISEESASKANAADPKPRAATPPPEKSPTEKPAETPKSDVKIAKIPPPVARPEAITAPWTADSKPNDAYSPLPEVAIVSPPQTSAPPPVGEDGYSIDEIREATRGFFGNVSTGLASVIEHAFKTSGRPTAYVLGAEGGGAFLAGLRFGKGTLYLRDQKATRTIYWHGPSVGTDFGASGSRTMFLIYKLSEPDAIYRSFTGVDGSAYFVGGVGVTLLKGGDVIMAPIRSGLGLRIGASLGYVRFTDSPTWNPF
ncbi:MAG: EipA family protein [Hyphomicrobium sp.]